MEKSFEQGVADHRTNQKAKIYGAFKKGKVAVPIVREEFEKSYPLDRFDHYSLDALDRFRQDLLKAEDVEDKDGAFTKATEDLTPHVVYDEGKKIIMYTRLKQKGE